ncbi:hypothetical protein HY251_00680 [bacterium]|nr:hypothetical protein [bacterium]
MKLRMAPVLLLVFLGVSSLPSLAEEKREALKASSADRKIVLLELYTSQG